MRDKVKFQFTPEFQFDIIRFCVIDRLGKKIIGVLDDSYFSLIEHAFIFYGIKKFHKTYRKSPGRIALRQELSELFTSRDFYDKITAADEARILTLCDKLYEGNLRDGDVIYEKIEKFIQYVEFKGAVEEVDLEDFAKYSQFSTKIQKAISRKITEDKQRGTFLIKDIKDRQLSRQESNPVIPTPWRQLNSTTNAGGYSKHSVIVVLDQPKKFKTGMLINTAIGYMKMKYVVLVVDLENGEEEYTIRGEQIIGNCNKRQILEGTEDIKIQKILRKYKRLGAELVVHRLPAYSTTAIDIRNIIRDLYKEHGIVVQILVVDYAAKLGTTDKREDDTSRIDRAYVELQNLALEENIYHIWTAHHVQRPADKRERTRYLGSDVAKSIDITRHVQAIVGLNRTPEEEEQGFFRMEIVEQRDGKKGRAVFTVNLDTQKVTELTATQRKEYDEIFNHALDEDTEEEKPEPPKKVKKDL